MNRNRSLHSNVSGILGTFAIGFLVLTGTVSAVSSQENEMAKYSVVSTEGAIELRDYAPMIIAEVTVEGAREPAITQGFRMLAAYIFGANAPGEKIAMTAPVMQQPAATGDGGVWNVRFMMPSKYTMETLPKPQDGAVRLTPVPAARYATIRFPGDADDEKLVTGQQALLKAFMDKNALKADGAPVYAFFDPPWISPDKRRNEIHIRVAQ